MNLWKNTRVLELDNNTLRIAITQTFDNIIKQIDNITKNCENANLNEIVKLKNTILDSSTGDARHFLDNYLQNPLKFRAQCVRMAFKDTSDYESMDIFLKSKQL